MRVQQNQGRSIHTLPFFQMKISFHLKFGIQFFHWDPTKQLDGYNILGESYGEQCVVGVRSFYSAVLFSVETQATIGYGSHYISNRCYPGFVVLYLQMVLGSILQSLLCAVVISKFAHPKFRRSDILFRYVHS